MNGLVTDGVSRRTQSLQGKHNGWPTWCAKALLMLRCWEACQLAAREVGVAHVPVSSMLLGNGVV